jgi:hypothetical protein
VLFSNETVAAVINYRFEPVWVSLRPVPLITIDFGNGKIVRRTLHGNVATYACTSDGTVLDILPGIYEPKTYVDRLGQLNLLFKMVENGKDKLQGLSMLNIYHRRQFEALNAKNPPLELSEMRMASITGAEAASRILMQPARRIRTRAAFANKEKVPTKLKEGELANWEALAKDTEQNETIRRRAIHEYLLKQKNVKPDDVAKWIYREVLHADLDDPYMGLGDLLFDTYPFAEEDMAVSNDSRKGSDGS